MRAMMVDPAGPMTCLDNILRDATLIGLNISSRLIFMKKGSQAGGIYL
jgi:hypothetical protein